MRTYLILIRGVNVGGKNIVSMAELKKCLAKLGFSDVVTYIESGNVVLESSQRSEDIKTQIEAALPRNFKLDSQLIKVLVLSQSQLEAIINNKPMGFVDVEYGGSEPLNHLQQEIVSALNSVRNDMRDKDRERMQEAEGLVLQNFQVYGYKYVGELFRPHVSFTRFGNEQLVASEQLPDFAEFSGFTRLGLFEMGDNGACVRKIADFELHP